MLLEQRWRLYSHYLSRSTKPILVGPWRSEVGFEVLYWIPWLHKFMVDHRIAKERLIAIGRGGSAAWYGFAGTADLYEHVPVEVTRTLSLQAFRGTGSIKQKHTEGWEKHVCGLTAASLGMAAYHILSPSWMYGLLAQFWEGKTSQRWLNDRVAHPVKYVPPPLGAEVHQKLPQDFIAMRWYSRATWPHREDLVLWMRQTTERMAKTSPVVLIDSFHADDHADINLGKIENTVRLSDLTPMTPLDNLAVQSAVIARAKAYVGTYGGMSQLAMRFGVPTLALYEKFGETAPEHLQLTQYLSLRTGVPFIACTPKQVDGVLPGLLGRA